VFQYLLQEALYGKLPVYFAAVKLARIRRFDPVFRPEKTRDGPEVVSQIMDQWRAGNFGRMWVYPKGKLFIVSDDYFTLAAAEKGQPDFVPCWVLGPVDAEGAADIQGPIKQDSLRKMMGVE
jgi:hypothetical protein